MAARMKIIIISRRILHSFQIVGHRLPGKFPEILFGGAGVQRIGRMGNDPAEMMLSCQRKKFLYIFLIDLLSLPASGISRKKSEGVPAVGDHLARHVFISFGRSRMISDVQAFLSLPFILFNISLLYQTSGNITRFLDDIFRHCPLTGVYELTILNL